MPLLKMFGFNPQTCTFLSTPDGKHLFLYLCEELNSLRLDTTLLELRHMAVQWGPVTVTIMILLGLMAAAPLVFPLGLVQRRLMCPRPELKYHKQCLNKFLHILPHENGALVGQCLIRGWCWF